MLRPFSLVARYEVAVATNVTFHTRRPPYPVSELPIPETVAIEFEGRRFVWHAVERGDGIERWPTVTVVYDASDPADYPAARAAMERLLSAIAYQFGQSINAETKGGAGVVDDFHPPVAAAFRRGLADHLHQAPAEVVVGDDERLRRVLGYFREALGTGSPFFKFLAYWNALSVACVDLDGELKPWLVATMEKHPNLRGDNKPPPPDWWEYLFWEQRGAVAHAVRGEKYPPEMDPDDPETQSRFDVDARLLQDLVRIRVRERWGDHAVYGRPRPEHFDGPAD